jgi:type IV secretory pathway VirB2 component (pilin)
MNVLLTPVFRRGIAHGQNLRRMRSTLCLLTVLLVLSVLAEAQFTNSPFDTGLTALQSLFTGTVAKVARLIAIVIGGYQFAHGEPGAKKVPRRPTSVSRAMLYAFIWSLPRSDAFSPLNPLQGHRQPKS